MPANIRPMLCELHLVVQSVLSVCDH
jgi:hypothetical protein